MPICVVMAATAMTAATTRCRGMRPGRGGEDREPTTQTEEAGSRGELRQTAGRQLHEGEQAHGSFPSATAVSVRTAGCALANTADQIKRGLTSTGRSSPLPERGRAPQCWLHQFRAHGAAGGGHQPAARLRKGRRAHRRRPRARPLALRHRQGDAAADGADAPVLVRSLPGGDARGADRVVPRRRVRGLQPAPSPPLQPEQIGAGAPPSPPTPPRRCGDEWDALISSCAADLEQFCPEWRTEEDVRVPPPPRPLALRRLHRARRPPRPFNPPRPRSARPPSPRPSPASSPPARLGAAEVGQPADALPRGPVLPPDADGGGVVPPARHRLLRAPLHARPLLLPLPPRRLALPRRGGGRRRRRRVDGGRRADRHAAPRRRQIPRPPEGGDDDDGAKDDDDLPAYTEVVDGASLANVERERRARRRRRRESEPCTLCGGKTVCTM